MTTNFYEERRADRAAERAQDREDRRLEREERRKDRAAADFARVLAAVDQVTGWTTQASYKATAADAVADVLDGEPFAQAVVDLVRAAGPTGVELTAAQLLESVNAPEKLPKKWPKDPTRAAGQLKRLAPALRTIGIEVDDSKRQPDGNRSRLYRLTASERSCISAPGAPAAPETASEQQVPPGASELASTRTAPGSTRDSSAPGAAGAAPGATSDAAPGKHTTSDLRQQPSPGAPGAPGAGLHLFSDADPLCTACGTALDPALAAAGETTHPGCDPTPTTGS